MSHFTTIQTQIKDIDALQDACVELDLELIRDAEARGYSTAKRLGDYVIRLKGPYDIALNQLPDGTYDLTTDWWKGHVSKEVGPNYGRLLQLYGVHKTIREARSRRLRVTRKAQTNGTIKLTLHNA